MAVHKSLEPVFCRYCGKMLRKWTVTVYVRDEPTKYDHAHGYCRYVYPPQKLKNKADCQKFTNQQVVSVSYSYPTQDGDRIPGAAYVQSFNEWDGESWDDPYFCGAKCAQGLAYAILGVQPSWGTKAYREARDAVKKALDTA
jgi:ribosomal protein L24E